MEYTFPVTRTTHPKPRPEDETKLGFARYFTPEHGILPLYKPTFPTRSSPQKAAAFYSAVSGV